MFCMQYRSIARVQDLQDPILLTKMPEKWLAFSSINLQTNTVHYISYEIIFISLVLAGEEKTLTYL